MVVLDMVYPAILLPLLFAFDELRPCRPTFWLHVAVGFIYAADMLVVLHRWAVGHRASVSLRHLDPYACWQQCCWLTAMQGASAFLASYNQLPTVSHTSPTCTANGSCSLQHTHLPPSSVLCASNAYRGVVVRYLDQHVYVDDPWDIFTLYLWHGHFLYDLPVALTGPLQLLALLRADTWLDDGGCGAAYGMIMFAPAFTPA
jgi:hypothetical protein